MGVRDMSSTYRHRFAIALFLIAAFLAQAVWASSVIVHHNVNLRHDPSTDQPPIVLLKPPTTLTLLNSTRTHGYYHVALSDGTEGWVYGTFVHLIEPYPSNAPGLAKTIDPSWNKPAPVTGTFSSEGTVCGPTGDGGDRATNRRKNRTDVPGSYHDVSFQAIASTAYPIKGHSRADWQPKQFSEVARFEGVPVRVIGFIAALRTEGAELTNCKMTHAAQVDWHIALVAEAGQEETKAIVVETTPRVRQYHPGWKTRKIGNLLECGRRSGNWVDCRQPVRISGWLMLDPKHPELLGKYRETLWEIHPITDIEVQEDGHWVALDDAP